MYRLFTPNGEIKTKEEIILNPIINMKAIAIILFALFLLFVGHLQISFKPFSIELPYWHRSLGLLLLILSFLVYNIGERAKGYSDGFNECLKTTIGIIEKKNSDK